MSGTHKSFVVYGISSRSIPPVYLDKDKAIEHAVKAFADDWNEHVSVVEHTTIWENGKEIV